MLSAWPIIGNGSRQLACRKAELAMAVRGKDTHYELAGIRRRHWDNVAHLAGLKDTADIVDSVVQAAPSIIVEVAARLPKAYPSHVADRIFTGLEESLARLTE